MTYTWWKGLGYSWHYGVQYEPSAKDPLGRISTILATVTYSRGEWDTWVRGRYHCAYKTLDEAKFAVELMV